MNLQESIRNDLNKLNESNDFFKYVESFYGDGEIYARYFANDDGSEGASMEEITKAIDTLTNDDKWSWGGGDSMDREKVRDIMLANRETDHDDLNKITEAGDKSHPEGNDEEGYQKLKNITDIARSSFNRAFFTLSNASTELDLYLNDIEFNYSAEFGQSQEISELYDLFEDMNTILNTMVQSKSS